MSLKDVPVLEHLTLDGPLELVVASDQPEPRLRSLVLENVTFKVSVTVLPDLGWRHLTQLRVRFACLPWPARRQMVGHTVLALRPNLQDFSFSPVAITQFHMGMMQVLTHAHLCSLDVFVQNGAACLLDALTLSPQKS